VEGESSLSWYKDLAYYFESRWSEHREPDKMVPEALFAGVSRALGEFMPTLTHPTDLEGGAISFLMVDKDDSAVLVHFDPPSTTRFEYVGSLAGGRYQETVELGEDGYELSGIFTHDRLETPIRFRLTVPNDPSQLMPATRDAGKRTALFRDKLVAWAKTE
jgi:hypothetical protein